MPRTAARNDADFGRVVSRVEDDAIGLVEGEGGVVGDEPAQALDHEPFGGMKEVRFGHGSRSGCLSR